MSDLPVRNVPCWECFGTGLLRDHKGISSDEPCKVCNGKGEFLMTDRQTKPTIEQQINPDNEQDKL